ncbi:esterase/lipase family protein [Amycolatopsis saalfeldensis]|uniref:Triacylglycerol esterase/lipase EstA, alpha/beta hydrolase fold n=1 Tax=Amycolatopsis saalfeldensis TaxID=394193 RepID=A0A1H8RM45_9PSEU|nr:alpha/beta fold hydrolase [Amycolatopsis saalfeldensis]SEO67033.1 Triacylglycerol esterase/lipase EstA, alpha/beta hydrolase fold [Amycolatopsis saalfeldensis]
MRMRLRTKAAVLAAAALVTAAFTAAPAQAATGGDNDPSCRPSAAHPHPVVFLHGLGATYYEDLNFMQSAVAAKGYCTFSQTYGAYPGFPVVGGLRPIADSAAEIKAFIGRVLAETGASKVDIVGHSEGGFQSLYVTKTQGIADKIGTVVAIAPPTHGTTFGGLTKLAYLLGQGERDAVGQALSTLGCPACDNLITDGAAVTTLDNGPIAQPGVRYTVLTSRADELVTPTDTAFVREPGVDNQYVQDTCPFDPVGHIGEAYDLNVWNLVTNALDPAHATKFLCVVGSPG